MLKKSFLLLLLTTLLTACGGGDGYQIISPEDNSKFLTTVPTEFRISFIEKPSSIILNGVEVLDYFEFNEAEAWVAGEALQGIFIQGNNNLAVEPLKFGPRHTFFIDNKGPKVVLLEVPDVTPSAVFGKLLDPSGARSLMLNGSPVFVDNKGGFQAVVEPSPVYNFYAEDKLGQVSTTLYAARETVVQDITKVRVNEKVFDDALPFVQELVEEQDLSPLLEIVDADTLFNEKVSVSLPKTTIIPKVCVPVLGCTPEVALGPFTFNIVELSATIQSLSLDELDIADLDINSGFDLIVGNWEGLTLDATVEDLDIGLRINADVLGIGDAIGELLDFLGLDDELDALDGNFPATLAMPKLRFGADLGLSANQGNVDIGLVNVNAIGLGDFNSDFDLNFNVPQAFRDFGFGLAGLVIDTVEAGIKGARDIIVSVFLETLVPLIANLIIEPLINSIQIQIAAALDNGSLISVLTEVDTIDVINNNTSLLLSLNGRLATEATADSAIDLVNSKKIDTTLELSESASLNIDDLYILDMDNIPTVLAAPANLAPAALGFLYTDSPLPNPNNQGDLELAVSSNFINQTILALYQAKLLSAEFTAHHTLQELTFTDPENANAKITLEATSPPEFSLRGDQFSVAFITLNHYTLRYQRRKQNGEWGDGLEIDFSADLPINVGVDDKEGIQISIINPDFNTVINGQVLSLGVSLPDDRPRLITALLPRLLDDIQAKLNIFAFDQTQVGFTLEPRDIYSVGTPKAHLGLSVDTGPL